MIELEVSNYQNPYFSLNGQQFLNVTPLSLARALVTVGRSSWGDVFDLGIFRIGELICKALGFTEIKNGHLVLQDKFDNLNQSEKVTISYYLGQALTKLYAERYFEVKWLLHVDDYAGQIQFSTKGTVLPKFTVGRCTKVAKRPDLIGISKRNTVHIFEAKGNSGGYDKSTMQHALNQVSQVQNYNGNAPETRTACYFDLSDLINGIIIDPEGDENGVDIKLEEMVALESYYKFFIANSSYFRIGTTFQGYTFLLTPVGIPGIFFGFDERILKMNISEILDNGLYPDGVVEEFYGNQKDNQATDGSGDISLGKDGIILMNINNFRATKRHSLWFEKIL